MAHSRRFERQVDDLRVDAHPGPPRAAQQRVDLELPAEWLICVLTDLIHAASRQVTAGAMDSDTAERVLLRSASAALTSHRAQPV
jgi:hypothetical protein